MYSKDQIEKSVLAKNYIWFSDVAKKTYDVNIVGVRNMTSGNTVTNLFDDLLTISFKDSDDNWCYFEYPITTDPGKKAMVDYGNPNGVFRLLAGQYRGMWRIGLHQGKYEALTQAKNCKGTRDKDKDQTFDGTTIVEGIFGINCHRSNPKTESTFVENWSEGCQVFKKVKDFNNFMDICKKASVIHGNSFTYTLLESKDIAI